MQVAGVLEPDGSVTYGYVEQSGPYGAASRLVDVVAAFDEEIPDRTSVIAALAEQAPRHGLDIWQAPDVAGYIEATASITKSPLSMLLCADGWVGWPARDAVLRSRYERKVAALEQLMTSVRDMQGKIEDIPGMDPRRAAAAREWARTAAANALVAAEEIGLGSDAPWMDEVEKTLGYASRRVRTTNLLADVRLAHSQAYIPLTGSRRRLEELTKRSNWLPGAANWTVSGVAIVRGLDAVIEALADVAAAAGSAAEAARLSLRASKRSGAELRRTARSYAGQALVSTHDAALHHRGLPDVRTGLDDIVEGLLGLCRETEPTRDIGMLESRTRLCAERANRTLAAARLVRRCAHIALAATASDRSGGRDKQCSEGPAASMSRVSRRLLRQEAHI